MNSEKIVLELLEKVGAIITNDHFVYTSGKHGSVYIRKDKLYPYTRLVSQVCRMIAEDVRDLDIEVVVGPAIGGIVLSQWTAYHLSELSGKDVLSIFTEKDYSGEKVFDREQFFKRGYERLVSDRRVLVLEDLINTGDSVKKVVNQVKAVGGEVLMTYVLVNRSPDVVNDEFVKAPFKSLAVFEAEAFEADECPLCKENRPINTEVGHGKEFLEKKGLV